MAQTLCTCKKYVSKVSLKVWVSQEAYHDLQQDFVDGGHLDRENDILEQQVFRKSG